MQNLHSYIWKIQHISGVGGSPSTKNYISDDGDDDYDDNDDHYLHLVVSLTTNLGLQQFKM